MGFLPHYVFPPFNKVTAGWKTSLAKKQTHTELHVLSSSREREHIGDVPSVGLRSEELGAPRGYGNEGFGCRG